MGVLLPQPASCPPLPVHCVPEVLVLARGRLTLGLQICRLAMALQLSERALPKSSMQPMCRGLAVLLHWGFIPHELPLSPSAISEITRQQQISPPCPSLPPAYKTSLCQFFLAVLN